MVPRPESQKPVYRNVQSYFVILYPQKYPQIGFYAAGSVIQSRATIVAMKNRFAYAVAALLSCSTLAASAQSCHTVRDAQGKIVYQSIRPPVDTTVPYKDEIEALFPGGYLQIEPNFFRCGNHERPAHTGPAAPPGNAKALAPLSPDARRTRLTAEDLGDYAKHVPPEKAANMTPNPFEDLIPKPANDAATRGITAGIANQAGIDIRTTASPTTPVPDSTDMAFDPSDWMKIAAAWGGIALFAFAIFAGVNRVNQGSISAISSFIFALRALRVVLAVLLITQAWTFIEAFVFAKDNPAVLSRLEFIVPVLLKLVWVAMFVLLFDYLRRRINALHQRKFGGPHSALKERWSL